MTGEYIEPKPAPEPKPPIKSKTIWAGTCVAGMSVIGFVQGQDWVQNNPALVCVLGVAVGGLMVAFRCLTNALLTPPTIVVKKP